MAGSGKTTLLNSISKYLSSQGSPGYLINLDPAVMHLGYRPNIDIRDTVRTAVPLLLTSFVASSLSPLTPSRPLRSLHFRLPPLCAPSTHMFPPSAMLPITSSRPLQCLQSHSFQAMSIFRLFSSLMLYSTVRYVPRIRS